ncbi:siderophore-interacting protein [Streptomyces sp. NPDC052052]|uniref:siderophore-interacting protein n=1 Tax=Streptomyces sp. NPDC052052 TaxID=3154756 RepID=UPI0034331D12
MPRTSRPLQIHPIVMRRAVVTRVIDVTPHMRRITLSGPELAAGEMGAGFERPPFRSDGFDDHVKMIFPPAEGELPSSGVQQETRFAWNPEILGYTRDYTVRSWDPENQTFDIDVARHDHGLATSWAFRAQPGDEVQFAGPKTCTLRNDEAQWHLLVGDDTALPAIGRWLEEAPQGTRGHVIVEIPTLADRQEIETAADVEIEWLVRGDAPAGTSTQLFDAVRRVAVPDCRVYAWVAGEAMTIAPIRRYLRRDLALPKEDIEVTGYWRLPPGAAVKARQPADRAEQAVPGPAKEDEETATQLITDVHEMTELLPPIVTRVAVTLGIGPAVAYGMTTLDSLAREVGVEATALRPLLEAMTALGLLEADGEHYRNTGRGAVLMEPSSQEELSLDNPVNREALALVDLVDVLRSGRPASRLGDAPWRERRSAVDVLDSAHQERAAEELQYVLPMLAQLPAVTEARTLAVFGDASAVVASQVAQGRTVQIPGTAGTTWAAHDCAVLVAVLEGRSDEEALSILRTALAAGPAVVLAERTCDRAAADDHVSEYALTSLAVTGRTLRTRAQCEELLRRAGASTVERSVLGWGFGPFGTVTVAHV